MRFWTLLALTTLPICAASSCNRGQTPADFNASVMALRQYATSFKGLSVEEARQKLAGGEVSDAEWSKGDYGGKQLVARFPEYEVRVMFLKDKALTASIQILSERQP